jgi:2',3'-cyclic-nucleotide 2'-phosphodiesterase (5'-nucleotidase family)
MKKVFLISVFVSLLVSCGVYQLQKSEGVSVGVTDLDSDNSELTDMVAPYKNSLDSTMNEVIAISDMEMSTGSPQGLLGNWACDLSLEIGNELYKEVSEFEADFSLLNNGGLRTFLPEGEVTRRKIFEIMPFENELVVITLSPEKTAELFRFIAAKTVKEGNRKQGVPVSSNIEVYIKEQLPVNVLIDSVPLKGRNYRVITSDYLANGGDNMSFFLNPVSYEKVGIKLRDAMLVHCERETKKGKALTSNLDKRIMYVN